jgi:hypothetical protein
LNTAIFIGLSTIVFYLGKRWLGARAEVSDLLVENALLKRRLARSAR